jgi:uncharacterized protein YjlB
MKQFQSGALLPQHTHVFLLNDDGVFPNNEHLPAVLYEHCFQISNEDEAADHIERVLEENAWHHPWRNGIYDYHHFHSTAHEVLVCYSGRASVLLGGPDGTEVHFNQGDVLILPAGTAHKCEEATSDFKCIGAYPLDQMFDVCYGKIEERAKAHESILKVPLPLADPIYGTDGPLVFHWNIQIAKRA